MKTVFVAVALAAVLVSPACAAMPRCEGSPALTSACFEVRGRLGADYQGTSPDRIWIIGTRRLLAIRDTDEAREHRDGPVLPANVTRAIGDPRRPAWVYGGFRVCPLEPEKPGAMRHVCLQSGTGLTAQPMRQ